MNIMKIWLAVVISVLWLTACDEQPRQALPPTTDSSASTENPRAFNPLSLENRRLRNALVFLNNKDKYSAAQLEAVEAPKQEFFRTLSCLSSCRADFLGHLDTPVGAFSRDDARRLAQAIQELICVPLSINMPGKVAREELLRNIPDYDPALSQVVVCYKQNSDMVMHIKNNELPRRKQRGIKES